MDQMAEMVETMGKRLQTRRIGHANMFVKHDGLEESVGFYRDVVGLEVVRREPEIAAALLSCGQTHHDVAVVEVAEEARLGADGSVQIAASRARKTGMNHFGWETNNEADLVEAHAFAMERGIKIHKAVDHQISRSLYVFDPDGHLNEWYADIMADWRRVLNPEETHLVTTTWEVGNDTPKTEQLFHVDPPIVRDAAAVFHPLGFSHSVIVARNFERMLEHYVEFAGLQDIYPGNDDIRFLGGSLGKLDLVLVRRNDEQPSGIHHISFLVESEADLAASIEALMASGFTAEKEIDAPHKRSVFVRDPDDMLIEFHVPRSGAYPGVEALAGDPAAPYVV